MTYTYTRLYTGVGINNYYKFVSIKIFVNVY